jgi:peptidyl-prolyl cis-trans isomerase C
MSSSFGGKKLRALASAGALAIFFLAGCGQAGSEEKDKTQTGQVVARVNNTEITTHQINTMLAQVGAPQGADMKAIRENILRGLVDAEMLRQAGAEAGAGRDPLVIQSVRNAESSIIGQFGVGRAVRDAEPATQGEVEAFLRDNPNMFAQREFFIFETIVAPSAQVTPEVFKQLQGVDDLNAATKILNDRRIPNELSSFASYSNNLDGRFLEQLLKLPPGESFIIRDGTGMTFTRIVSRRLAPLTGQAASNTAQQMLDELKRQQAASRYVEAQRKAAKIEYLGEYAALAKAPAPGAAGPQTGASPTNRPAAAPASVAGAPAAPAAAPAPAKAP